MGFVWFLDLLSMVLENQFLLVLGFSTVYSGFRRVKICCNDSTPTGFTVVFSGFQWFLVVFTVLFTGQVAKMAMCLWF